MFGFTKRCLAVSCIGLLLLSGCTDTDNHTHPTTVSTSTQPHATSSVATTTTTVIANHITTTTSTSNRSLLTTTTTTARKPLTTTQPTASRPTVNVQSLGSHLIDAPILAQKPNYPSGCESISAVMLLNYWGESITVDQFIDEYLPKSNQFYTENGRYYGPNPYEYYVGDPRTTQAYGCMAPVIQRAINDYYGADTPLRNVTGLTLPELCKEYIANDQPVLVWVSIGMVEIYGSTQWYLEDGSLYTWPANEHCMLLVGYDESYYYFNDPYTGMLKKYAHWICEDRYKRLNQQALVIVK